MSGRGLHILMGGVFVHEYVGQCASCTNRTPGGDFDRCAAKGKKICCSRLRRGKKAMCEQFAPQGTNPKQGERG